MDDAVRRTWRRLQAVDPRLVDGLLVLVLTAAVVAEFLHDGIAPLKLLPSRARPCGFAVRARFPLELT